MINYRLTNTIVLLLTICSISVLLFVFYLEYFLNILPCKLCVWQRWPQAALVIIGIGILGTTKFRLIGCYLAIFSVLTGLVLGGYHYGIEQAFWAGPDSCSGIPSINDLQPEEILEELLNTTIKRCDEVSWMFLSISLAGWNLVLSLFLLISWIFVTANLKNVLH